MKKRIAVLLMAAVFSVTSLNLSAASIEQSAGAGVEDAEEKEEELEEPAPETPEATEPETTEVTEPETPEVTEPETEAQKKINPEKTEIENQGETVEMEDVSENIPVLMSLNVPEENESIDPQGTGIASVDGSECADLAAVMQKVQDANGQPVRITLLKDIYLEKTVSIEVGMDVTIDLNGKQVTVLKNETTGRSLYAIDNYGKFTLEDLAGEGKITARGIENLEDGIMIINSGEIVSCDSNGGAAVWNEANVTINGGTFATVHVGTASDNIGVGCLNNSGTALITGGTFRDVNKRAYAIISTGSIEITPASGNEVIVHGAHGGLAIDSGTAVVNGGSYSSDDYYGLYVSNDGKGTDPEKAAVIVNGGTFTGKTYSVLIGSDIHDPVNSTIEITGGSFNMPLNAQDVTEDDAILVSGGTFSGELDKKYCAPGYQFIKNEDGTFSPVELPKVASVGNMEYVTLAEAITAAGANEIVMLLEDVSEDVKIPKEKVLTIDLNGKNLTNVSNHTIYNEGTLTIVDTSGEKTGTVDNITHARAALYNEVGATVTMDGGTFIRSKENGITSENNGGNSYYAVLNHGTMTINDGVKVVQSGKYSSLLENGWQNGTQNTTEAPSVLTINGGVFDGGLNTIKNDDYGELKINNGTFTNVAQYAVMNWNIAEIRGGEFSSDASSVVWNGYSNDTMNKGQLTITGGTFIAPDGYYVIYNYTGYGEGEVQIGGGIYSSQYIINGNPEEHYMTGFAPQLREDGKYGIELKEAEPIADMVFVEADEDKFNEEQNKILEQLKNINDIAVEGNAVTEAVWKITDQWNENLSANLKEAKAALLKEEVIDQATADSATASVYLYVRPYLYMEVQDIDVTNKVLTVDMEMRYALIASTSPDGGDVITTSVAENTGATANAVILKGGIGEEALLLDIQGSVDITLPYPSMFTSTKLSVKHTKESGAVYYYTSDAAGGTIQFVNPHGFSEFQIREERKAVVSYQNASGTVTEKTYTDADIDSTKIEVDSKDGYLFEGWQYAGVEGTYRDTVLTEALLDKLAAAYEQNGNKPVTASPVFTAATAQINITMGMLDKDGKELKMDRTFYAAVFTDKDYKNLYGTVLQFAFQNSSKASTVVVAGVPNDGSSRTFYVTETDKNGNPIQGGKDFGYEIIVKGGTVTLAKDGTAEVTITNKEVKQSSSHKKKSHSSGNDESSAPAAQPASVASAQTGDNSPVALLLVLCIGALSGIVIIMHSRKKKSN